MTIHGCCIVSDHAYHANRFFSTDPDVIRDNCNDLFVQLRRQLLMRGIQLDTEDISPPQTAAFVIQIDVRQEMYRPRRDQLSYLYLSEPDIVRPRNYDPREHEAYSHVLTWNDSLAAQGGKYRLYRLAHDLTVAFGPHRFAERGLCAMIAAPKSSRAPHSLYGERVALARWMARHRSDDFSLFGPDWPASMRPPLPYRYEHRLPRLVRKTLDSLLPRNPTVKGPVPSKRAALQGFKFSIAYENSRDTPGYLSEKLFDSMCAGCIPVYWGADNIAELVPTDCFIDRRSFTDTKELVEFLDGISAQQFLAYQARMRDFLTSSAADPFRGEAFGRMVATWIGKDLGIDTSFEIATRSHVP